MKYDKSVVMAIDSLKPSEKVIYALNTSTKLSELKTFIKPDMLTGIAKRIYTKFYNDHEIPYTVDEYQFWDKNNYENTGHVPIIPKRLVGELKAEYEEHILKELIPKMKTSGDVSELMTEVYKAKDIFETSGYNFDTEIEKVLEKRSGATAGYKTGFEFLDNNTLGLKQGHIWVVGGYTSSGKTQLTLQIIREALQQNASVGIVSIEMTATDILDRILKIEEYNGLRGNHVDIVREYKLSITDKVYNIAGLKALVMSEPKNIYVIDFVQNLENDGKSEYEKITKSMRELQVLALEQNCCILVVSQVSNEGARAFQRVMSFKGSGAIAHSADVAVELYRDNAKEIEDIGSPEVFAMIKKNRHGTLGKQKLMFNSEGILVLNT